MKKRLAVTLCSAVAFAAYACPASMRAQSQGESNSQASSTSQQTTNTSGQNSQGVSAQSTNHGSQMGNSSATENGTSYRNGQKQNDNWQQGSNADANSPAAKQEAMNLVPAEATLTHTLDAKNAQTGQQISAKLQDQVQLKNGPELPKGTVLQGKVTADHVKPDSVRMAICFDKAKLSDGKTIPIKATVVGVARPQSDFQNNTSSQMNRNNSNAYANQNNTTGQMNGSNNSAEASQNGTTGQMNGNNNSAEASQNGTTGQMNGNSSTAEATQNGTTGQMNSNSNMNGSANSTAEANRNSTTGQMNQSNLPASTAYAATWTPNTLQVDQINVVSGVDLHSRIHSKNSAVFVSQSKNDLKLDKGSQLTLAIGKSQSQSYSDNNESSPSM